MREVFYFYTMALFRTFLLPFFAGMVFLLLVQREEYQQLGDPGHYPLHLWLSISTAIAGGSLFFQKKKLESSGAEWIFLFLGLWMLGGLSGSWAVSEFWTSVFRWLGYAGALWAIAAWVRQGSLHFLHLSAVLAGMAFVLGMDALLEFLPNTLTAWRDPYVVKGLLGHKNFTSSALLLSGFGALYVALSGPTKYRWIGTLCTLLAVGMVVLLRTRSLWIGGVLGVFVLAYTLWPSFQKKRMPLPLGVIFGVGTLLTVGLLSSSLVREALLNPSNLSIRQVYWHHSAEMARENPIMGVGSGQWGVHFPAFGLNQMDPTVAEGLTTETRPHNDFVWIWAENGTIGLLLWILFWIALLSAWLRLSKTTEKGISGAVLVALLVYSLFEFPVERAATFFPFLLMAGWVLGQSPARPARFTLPAPIIGIFVLLCGSVGAYAAYQRIDGEVLNLEVEKHNANRQPQPLVEAATKAYSSWNELDRYGNPLPYFQGMGTLFLEAQAGSKEFTRAESHFRQALALSPYHIVTINQLGNVYKYREDYPMAKKWYRKALDISRDFGSARLNLAEVLLAQQKPDSAARVLYEAFGQSTDGASIDIRQNPQYKALVMQALHQATGKDHYKPLEKLLTSRKEDSSPEVLFEWFEASKDAHLQRASLKK